MKEEDHIRLLREFIAGNISDDKKDELITWLQSEEGRAYLDKYMSNAWAAAKSSIDAATQLRMLQNLKARIQNGNQIQAPHARRIVYRWLAYAAAAVILIVCTFTATTRLMNANRYDSNAVCKMNVDKGQRASITLPDGTQVYLNSDTRITYPKSYGDKERRVTLSGEAYFDVAKDAKHKFVVEANGVDVEALGTAFNVNAYPENKDIITTLFRGKVRVSFGDDEIILSPSEDVAINSMTHQFAHHTLSGLLEASLWRQGQLSFKHKTLQDIALTLNRTYNVNIVIRNNRIRNYTFTGVIRDNNLNNVLDMITLASHIKYTIKNDTVTLDE
jgi:transmembrane sensor